MKHTDSAIICVLGRPKVLPDVVEEQIEGVTLLKLVDIFLLSFRQVTNLREKQLFWCSLQFVYLRGHFQAFV